MKLTTKLTRLFPSRSMFYYAAFSAISSVFWAKKGDPWLATIFAVHTTVGLGLPILVAFSDRRQDRLTKRIDALNAEIDAYRIELMELLHWEDDA